MSEFPKLYSNNGDWLSHAHLQIPRAGVLRGPVGWTLIADLIPYFQVGFLGTLYKQDSQQPVSENGEASIQGGHLKLGIYLHKGIATQLLCHLSLNHLRGVIWQIRKARLKEGI